MNTLTAQQKGKDGEPKKGDTHTIRQLWNDEIEQLFTPLKQTTSPNENIFGFLKEVIEHTHKLIKKERMENEYIDKYRGKLSARELLSQGKTLYMNPCLDLVLVTIEGLKKIGIQDIGFVVEELQCPGNRYKLHFGIEITIQWKTYHIDYRTKNTVYVGAGKFKSDYMEKWEKVANTIYIPADQISADDTIYTLINTWKISFNFFDQRILDMLREKLKKDNNDEQWEQWFLSHIKNIDKPEIIIEGEEHK